MKKGNIASYIIPFIFSSIGIGFLIAGYTAEPGALTDDGYPLNKFFYMMGGFFVVWPIVLFSAIIYFQKRKSQREEHLKTQGIKGKARVMGMRQTGVRINHVPQVVLDLHITTDFGEKLQLPYKKCIQPMYYSILRPDVDLEVYINPEKKDKVFVDLDETWRRMAGGTQV